MSVSIIIPTFNSASCIGNCHALLKQTVGRGAEILVVNDGSTDNTAHVVAQYSRVRLITQSNAGPAKARNRGVLEARGSIVLFTDDDCVPIPEQLDAMLEPFNVPELAGRNSLPHAAEEPGCSLRTGRIWHSWFSDRVFAGLRLIIQPVGLNSKERNY